MDMTPTLAAKSNQLTTDDLIAGPLTILITNVMAGTADQPVAISFEGDQGKPWFPCKSMRRVLVAAWGADAKEYVGRSVTLFRDPEVSYGGIKVGGIRISHLSNLDSPLSIALTVTRQKRAPYKVQPLKLAAPVDPVKQAADACVTAGLTFEGIAAFCEMVSGGDATNLAQLPREVLQRIIQNGISAETVAKCNAPAEPAPRISAPSSPNLADSSPNLEPDPDDLPPAWAA
jgi:hypothetical protein